MHVVSSLAIYIQRKTHEDTDMLQELFEPLHAGISSLNPDDIGILTMVTSPRSTC